MLEPSRLPRHAHTNRDWRIHVLAKDFRVEDVWALPTPGGPDDFPRLLTLMESFSPDDASPLVAALFAARRGLGRRLGWDGSAGFVPMYRSDREAAYEIANRTVRGVLHLGWVPHHAGGYRGQLAVLVAPNGRLGRAYMAAIAPFRYAVVYPTLLRDLGRRWRARATRLDVPPDVRALSTLPRVDYADAFLVPVDSARARSARSWAQAVLESAPAATRAQLLRGWSMLGLTHSGAGDTILGWTVRRDTGDTVLLGRRSLVGMPGELLFEVRQEGLLFATFVQHGNPIVRGVWSCARPLHVRTVLRLLDRVATDAVRASAPAE